MLTAQPFSNIGAGEGHAVAMSYQRIIASVPAFDCYAAAMSLLSHALLHERLAQRRQRIHHVAELLQALHELELR
ncbi:hypothetical protein ACUNHQ_15495 [Serratia sp. IR-2025]